MAITIISPGFFSTIQDIGRLGFQRYGVVASGAMDSLSYRLANLLVGNFNNEAVLEITLVGPTMEFQNNAVISICGANLTPKINGNEVHIGRTLEVRKGDRLSFGKAKTGFRCYLAVAGGFQISPVLESRSTYTQARLGGYHGRKLEKGDILPIKDNYLNKRCTWRVSTSFFNYISEETNQIRFIKGKQYEWFSKESQSAFITNPYRILSESNRMGYRLEGVPLLQPKPQELITEAVTFGSVQVPSNGLPIILMADRQTTGGYPKIAQVAAVDLPILAQKKPGEHITFTEISLEQAQELFINKERELNLLKRSIKERLKGML